MKNRLSVIISILLLSSAAGLCAQTDFPDTLSADQLYDVAVEAAANKGWERAKKALEKWMDTEDPTVESWINLGKAHLYLKDEKDAEKAFKKALDMDKNNREALENLCEVYLIREKEKDMLKTLDRLEKIIPDSRTITYYRALAADKFELEDYPEYFFWDKLEELVRTDPEDRRTLDVLCDAYINDGFLERGILFLTEMQDLHGERSEYLFQLARIYTHTGDKELALDLFRQIEEAGIENLTPRQRLLMSQELFALEEDNLACEAYFSAAREMDDNAGRSRCSRTCAILPPATSAVSSN